MDTSTPQKPGGKLIRIEAPHFVAGLEAGGGKYDRAAPILKYMAGWSEADIKAYIRRKQWKAAAKAIRDVIPSKHGDHSRHRGNQDPEPQAQA